MLSLSDFHLRPHIIVDYKGDDLLNAIKDVKPITLADEPPANPGLYIIHLMPGQEDAVENFLWKVHAQNNTCMYFDEAYMIDRYSHAYNALLTQGRSKNINLYNLTQRPAYCSRFVFSESSHLSVFQLIDKRDKKTMQGVVPLNLDENLPEYHSYWYDVKQNESFLMHPVPDRDIILETFNTRLEEIARSKRQNRRFI